MFSQLLELIEIMNPLFDDVGWVWVIIFPSCVLDVLGIVLFCQGRFSAAGSGWARTADDSFIATQLQCKLQSTLQHCLELTLSSFT